MKRKFAPLHIKRNQQEIKSTTENHNEFKNIVNIHRNTKELFPQKTSSEEYKFSHKGNLSLDKLLEGWANESGKENEVKEINYFFPRKDYQKGGKKSLFISRRLSIY